MILASCSVFKGIRAMDTSELSGKESDQMNFSLFCTLSHAFWRLISLGSFFSGNVVLVTDLCCNFGFGWYKHNKSCCIYSFSNELIFTSEIIIVLVLYYKLKIILVLVLVINV